MHSHCHVSTKSLLEQTQMSSEFDRRTLQFQVPAHVLTQRRLQNRTHALQSSCWVKKVKETPLRMYGWKWEDVWEQHTSAGFSRLRLSCCVWNHFPLWSVSTQICRLPAETRRRTEEPTHAELTDLRRNGKFSIPGWLLIGNCGQRKKAVCFSFSLFLWNPTTSNPVIQLLSIVSLTAERGEPLCNGKEKD